MASSPGDDGEEDGFEDDDDGFVVEDDGEELATVARPWSAASGRDRVATAPPRPALALFAVTTLAIRNFSIMDCSFAGTESGRQQASANARGLLNKAAGGRRAREGGAASMPCRLALFRTCTEHLGGRCKRPLLANAPASPR